MASLCALGEQEREREGGGGGGGSSNLARTPKEDFRGARCVN